LRQAVKPVAIVVSKSKCQNCAAALSSAKLIKAYSTTRDTTRREHLAQVQREFRDERAMALVSGLLEEMRTRKIVLPALSTVEGLVVDTLSLAEAMTFETLWCRMARQRRRLAASGRDQP
jgi:hypothetical protein